MDLEEFWRSIPEASTWNITEKVKLFAWYLHEYAGLVTFASADIRVCFANLNLDAPSSVVPFLDSLARKSPKQILRDGKGYRLEATVRQIFLQKYGQRTATVHVHNLLSGLPGRLNEAASKAYLEEALICFKHGAFRASVVMSWNLAYDHLCGWVLKNHLSAFNARLPIRYPRANFLPIVKRDDFSEMKEYEVIEVCNSARIITSSVFKVLDEKLKKRNLAAHPSGITVSQITAEEMIADLVENVVLKLV